MSVALITGPTSGIGHAFAHQLAAEGHELVLASRDQQRLEALAAELRTDHGIPCTVERADLAVRDDVRHLEQLVRDQQVDLLINNAGYGLGQGMHKTDVETEQQALDVMVGAPMRLMHAALPGMLERHIGDIVNVSSVAAFTPRGTYGAAKAYLTSLSRWANVAYAKRGVRVMALCPGFVRTEFHDRIGADVTKIPQPLWLRADNVVERGLADLRAGKAVSIPSRRYQALVLGSRLAPAGLVERAGRFGR